MQEEVHNRTTKIHCIESTYTISQYIQRIN